MSERITERASDDETIIMRVDDGQFFALSGTAIAVWRLINGKRTRDDLIAALSNEFVTNRDQIGVDVAELVDHLKEWGIVAED